MTVNELAKYFSDRKFFANPDQEVKFILSPKEIPLEKGMRLEMRGSTVPEVGEAVVAFSPAPVRKKFMFSLKFEANPVIEAQTLEEAEEKAFEMMTCVAVKNLDTDIVDEDYIEQKPYFLEEVKE